MQILRQFRRRKWEMGRYLIAAYMLDIPRTICFGEYLWALSMAPPFNKTFGVFLPKSRLKTNKNAWDNSPKNLNSVDITNFEISEFFCGWLYSPLSLREINGSYLLLVWLFILFCLFFSTCTMQISILFISIFLCCYILIEFIFIMNCILIPSNSIFIEAFASIMSCSAQSYK